MIRLARELLRIAVQLALLPLVWLFGAGAIATIVFAPIQFFKFGTGTGAEWDGFNVLVLANWKLEACGLGAYLGPQRGETGKCIIHALVR